MAEVPSYLQPNAAPQAPPAPQADVTDGVQSYEQVFDIRNNATINIPRSEVEIAVRSGLYAPLKDKEFVVKDSDGNTHAVDGINLKQAFDDGNTFASEEESHAHLLQRKHGNSEGLALLEGVERGALPGVSDRLLAGTKDFSGNEITQADLAGRAEANPISAGIGEAVGTFLSPLAKIPLGAAARTEAQVAKTLTKVGAKAGLTSKIAQSIVSKIIPKTAGSAVEGAYYGATHLLNEDALGTAQFNAENLLSSVEQGALWGAAFGGALATTGAGVKGVANAIAESAPGKYAAQSFDDLNKAFTSKEKAAREFLGIKPSLAKKLAEKDKGFMDDALKWTTEILEENPNASISEVASKASSDKASLGKRIGEIYNEVDKSALERGTDLVAKKSYIKTQIANEIEERVLPKFKGVEGVEREARSIQRMIDNTLESAMNVEGSYGATEIHKMLQNVDALINFDKPITGTTLKQEMLRAQRDVLRRQLNSMVELAEKDAPETLKGLLSELKQNNRRFQTIKSLEKAVAGRADDLANKNIISRDDVFTTAAGAALAGPYGAAGVVGKKFLESDMLRKMQILGKIEKFQQQSYAAIANGFKAMGKGVAKTEPLVNKALVDSALATQLVDGKKKKALTEQQAYRNILSNAQFASENPEQFLQGVNRYSSHMYAVAPKTSGALDTAALNAMVFLHSKSPKSQKPKGLFDAGKPSKASGQDILKLQQRIQMIEKPTKALELLQNNKLSPTHVETLKVVYPEMYGEIQKQAMNFISSKEGQALTYSQKLNLATLLDVQADESMHFENVLSLQANFERSGDGDSGVVSPTQTGIAKIDKADRMNDGTTEDEVV